MENVHRQNCTAVHALQLCHRFFYRLLPYKPYTNKSVNKHTFFYVSLIEYVVVNREQIEIKITKNKWKIVPNSDGFSSNKNVSLSIKAHITRSKFLL